MPVELKIFNEKEAGAIAQHLVSLMQQCQIFAFTGSLGAGKTTLIKHLLKKCGVADVVTSPTFTYLNVYQNSKGQNFYHFDLYRIATLEEFRAAGFDEYLYVPNGWTFIEWPSVIMPLLTKNVCFSEIDFYHEQRQIKITY